MMSTLADPTRASREKELFTIELNAGSSLARPHVRSREAQQWVVLPPPTPEGDTSTYFSHVHTFLF